MWLLNKFSNFVKISGSFSRKILLAVSINLSVLLAVLKKCGPSRAVVLPFRSYKSFDASAIFLLLSIALKFSKNTINVTITDEAENLKDQSFALK